MRLGTRVLPYCRRKCIKSTKKEQVEARSWKAGTIVDFLQLSPGESAYIEMKLDLGKNPRERRKDKSLTQAPLARLLVFGLLPKTSIDLEILKPRS